MIHVVNVIHKMITYKHVNKQKEKTTEHLN